MSGDDAKRIERRKDVERFLAIVDRRDALVQLGEALAAASSGAPVRVHVHCGQCRGGRALAKVHATELGLVLKVPAPPGGRWYRDTGKPAHVGELKRRAGERVTFVAPYLLAGHPLDPPPPVIECPRHGPLAYSPEELAQAAQASSGGNVALRPSGLK